MVWCHLCDCNLLLFVQIFADFPTSFGERIAVHRSQRPSFQSSLERFERSMVLHLWSTLRAMFASGWIVAVWCFDSEINSCRRAISKIMLESKAVSKSEKGCRQRWTQQKPLFLTVPGTRKYKCKRLWEPCPEWKKKRLSFWSWENDWLVESTLQLRGIKGFSLDRVLESDAEFLRSDQDHQHDQSVSSAFRLRFRRLVGIGSLIIES